MIFMGSSLFVSRKGGRVGEPKVASYCDAYDYDMNVLDCLLQRAVDKEDIFGDACARVAWEQLLSRLVDESLRIPYYPEWVPVIDSPKDIAEDFRAELRHYAETSETLEMMTMFETMADKIEEAREEML